MALFKVCFTLFAVYGKYKEGNKTKKRPEHTFVTELYDVIGQMNPGLDSTLNTLGDSSCN